MHSPIRSRRTSSPPRRQTTRRKPCVEPLERRTLLSFTPAPSIVEDTNLGRFADAATADFNSDGKIDIAATHIEGVSLWFGNGDGTLPGEGRRVRLAAGHDPDALKD
jgi:hypothetical protein